MQKDSDVMRTLVCFSPTGGMITKNRAAMAGGRACWVCHQIEFCGVRDTSTVLGLSRPRPRPRPLIVRIQLSQEAPCGGRILTFRSIFTGSVIVPGSVGVSPHPQTTSAS
jgi:hypothetical protein